MAVTHCCSTACQPLHCMAHMPRQRLRPPHGPHAPARPPGISWGAGSLTGALMQSPTRTSCPLVRTCLPSARPTPATASRMPRILCFAPPKHIAHVPSQRVPAHYFRLPLASKPRLPLPKAPLPCIPRRPCHNLTPCRLCTYTNPLVKHGSSSRQPAAVRRQPEQPNDGGSWAPTDTAMQARQRICGKAQPRR